MITLSDKPRNPTMIDYMAGVMLVNEIIWIWEMALATFSDFFSKISYGVLAAIAYVIYISGSTLASYLVCKKTSSKHLVVGLKLAWLVWLFSLMLGSITVPTPALAVVLLVCYGAGGMAGGYLALRSELGSRKIIQDREMPE